jgi:predicted outer membrane repeat protein
MNANQITSMGATALLLTSIVTGAHAATFYVKASAPAGGNGTSWSRAFNNLDSALNAARVLGGANQIWITSGTYKPSIVYSGNYGGLEPNLRTFNLPSNVTLYGGFAGNEKRLQGRNPQRRLTILSGDFNSDDSNTPDMAQTNKNDNAWHVLTADGVSGVTLDGLTITGGYAKGPDSGTLGEQFTLTTLRYAHDAGGGLLAQNNAKVTLNNIKFTYNVADAANASAALRGPSGRGSPALAAGGGAIAAMGAGTLVTINASSFDNNTAVGFGSNGGALSALLLGSFTVSNSTFTNNIGNRFGGAIHAKDALDIRVSSSTFKNNTISGNVIRDESGGAIGIMNGNLSIATSTFDGNSSGRFAGGGAIVFHAPFNTLKGIPYALTVSDSTFQNNRGSLFGGGAINIIGNDPLVATKATITTSAFNNNIAGNGGGIYVDGIPTILNKSTFTGNQAWSAGGAVFGGNFGDAVFGDTALANRPELSIINSTFTSNSIINAPADLPASVDMFNAFANFFSTNNQFPQASVTQMSRGGGAIAMGFASKVKISGSSFSLNTAPNAAGGAILVGGTAGSPQGMSQAFSEVISSTFSSNTAAIGNDTALLNPGALSCTPEGIQLILDGIVVCP